MNTLGYDTVSAREFRERKPLQLMTAVPQSRARLRAARAGAARCALSVLTYRRTPAPSSVSPASAASRRTPKADRPVALATQPSSSVHGE